MTLKGTCSRIGSMHLFVSAVFLAVVQTVSSQPSEPRDSAFIVTREFIYVKAPFPSAHASTIVGRHAGGKQRRGDLVFP
jgi:hypothetical protein